MGKVILKKGREKAIKNKHHWIFSGAVENFQGEGDGEILPVYSAFSEMLGYAFFNKRSNIIGRMLFFGEQTPELGLKTLFHQAFQLRTALINLNKTNAYRLVNGEGDGLPGLIIDRYADHLVIQVSTLGMERLKPLILEILKVHLNPKSIYEKSNSPSRSQEGLKPYSGVLYGNFEETVLVKENGLMFSVNIAHGQKTGFFLDHREMRQYVRLNSHKKRVLNCFSYTGGFSVYAGAGEAKEVTSVDISESAIRLAQENVKLNSFSETEFKFAVADVFNFLQNDLLNYDLVILDPPAFAKKQKDIVNACKGYKEINRQAMAKMPSGSVLITSSCSHFVDEKLFQQVVFQAGAEVGRPIKIIGKHLSAVDHPINLYHPESEYLKSLVLYLS